MGTAVRREANSSGNYPVRNHRLTATPSAQAPYSLGFLGHLKHLSSAFAAASHSALTCFGALTIIVADKALALAREAR